MVVMIDSFIIYLRAFGWYAFLTIPALIFPPLYIISLAMAALFGLFALGLFSLVYVFAKKHISDAKRFWAVLVIAVPCCVLFAFQMIELFGAWENIWESGALLIFPLFAMASGWISVAISENKSRETNTLNTFLEGETISSKSDQAQTRHH